MPVPMRRLVFLLPVGVFCILAVYLGAGLTRDSQRLPSVLVNTPVAEFRLPPIKGRDNKERTWGLESLDFRGEVSLLNVFGSWCLACRLEHPFLMTLKQSGVVPIHGMDWREPDPDAGPRWLEQHGDAYTLVGDDPHSRGAIAFGVTGAPETFVVDRQGIIRYKHTGPLGPEVWADRIYPLILELRAQ